MTPEQEARAAIDWLLEAAGRDVADVEKLDIHPSRGVAIREPRLRFGGLPALPGR